MCAVMSGEVAQRMAVNAGRATLGIGGVLALVPRLGAPGGLADPRGARIVGALDLALVPGLVLAERKRPWLAARAGLNVAIVAYALVLRRGGAPRAGLLAGALSAVTVVDALALTSLEE